MVGLRLGLGLRLRGGHSSKEGGEVRGGLAGGGLRLWGGQRLYGAGEVAVQLRVPCLVQRPQDFRLDGFPVGFRLWLR